MSLKVVPVVLVLALLQLLTGIQLEVEGKQEQEHSNSDEQPTGVFQTSTGLYQIHNCIMYLPIFFA